MTKKAKQAYQYEAPVTPSKWTGEEQRFSIRVKAILEDLYQKFGSLSSKTSEADPGNIKSVNGVEPDANGNVAVRKVYEVSGNQYVTFTVSTSGVRLTENYYGSYLYFRSDESGKGQVTVRDAAGNIINHLYGTANKPKFSDIVGCPFVTPQQFGAKADGKTDDSAAVQAAFDAGSIILFPEGSYLFSGITCTHDVRVIFSGANLVPKHPSYDASTQAGDQLVQYDYGVFENFFRFTGCRVEMDGLALLADETPRARSGNISLCPATRSIAEFDTCERVVLRGWHVRGLSLFNRGNTPSAFYDRRGIVFTAIDTDILVQDCVFENIQWDEWTWCTYRDNLNAAKCTFDHCTFRSPATKNLSLSGTNTPGLTCANICYASEAIVQDCVFEDISYSGSMVNTMGLLSVFRNNTIVGCTVEGVCDCMEGAKGLFANEVIVENNTMADSSCTLFAKFGAKRAYVKGNSGVVAGRFIYAIAPSPSNEVREDDVVDSLRVLVEGNDAVCTGIEALAADNAFMRFTFNHQTGIWESEDSEVIVRNNRFVRSGSIRANSLIVAGDVRRMIIRDCDLFWGHYHGSTAHAYVMHLASAGNTAQYVEVINNVLDGATIPANSTTKAIMRISGTTVTSIDARITGNLLWPSAAIPSMVNSVASGCSVSKVEAQNIGFDPA